VAAGAAERAPGEAEEDQHDEMSGVDIHEASTSRTVLNNSILLVIEMSVGMLTTLAVNVPVLRHYGPAKMNYYMIVQWVAFASTGALFGGVPAACRRYMAEMIGKDDLAMARSIYFYTLKLQTLVGLAMILVGEALVFTVSRPDYRVSSMLLVLALLPRMLTSVPSQAQLTANRIKDNLISVIVASATLAAATWASLILGWDLVGVAAAVLTSYVVELGLKAMFVQRWLGWGPQPKLERGLKRRMATFSWQGLVVLCLNFIVLDKSDLLFLQRLRHDDKLSAYFSVGFNLADKTLQVVASFVGGVGISMMNQLKSRTGNVEAIAAKGLRYCLLLASPMLFLVAGVGKPLILTLYGEKYGPAGAILSLAAVLALGKSLLPLVQLLFQTREKQAPLAVWIAIFSAVNIGLDLALIPPFGAVGATVANGLTQVLLAGALLWWAQRTLQIRWHLGRSLLTAIPAALGAAAAYWVSLIDAPAAVRLAAGLFVGGTTYVLMLRVFRTINEEDVARCRHLIERAPGWSLGPAEWLIGLVAPARGR
jgi:O-antigen/teichoic acid export membrane protein